MALSIIKSIFSKNVILPITSKTNQTININNSRNFAGKLFASKSDERGADVALPPPPPKRPTTPWTAFVLDKKDQVIKENGSMKATEITKILAKEWSTLDKSDYIRDYARRREAYNSNMEFYKSSLTEEQKELLKKQNKLSKENKKKISLLKEMKALNPPKKSRHQLTLYYSKRWKDQDIIDMVKRSSHISDVTKFMFNEFSNLSQWEKDKYRALEEEDKERFKREFNDWYEKCRNDEKISEGCRNLIETRRARCMERGHL